MNEILEVSEGCPASAVWWGLRKLSRSGWNRCQPSLPQGYFDDVTPDKKDRIRKNLEDYCGRDAEGMIFILRELKRLVKS